MEERVGGRTVSGNRSWNSYRMSINTKDQGTFKVYLGRNTPWLHVKTVENFVNFMAKRGKKPRKKGKKN